MSVTPNEPAHDRWFHRLIAEGSHDLHTITSADGIYRFASPASLALFGWAPHELLGKPQSAFAHPDDVELVEGARRRALAGSPEPSTSVWRFRRVDGAYRWTETISRAALEDGEVLIVATIRDIGDRKQSELVLQHRATTDPLTGIANRSVFMDRLQQALRRLERRDALVAVLFLDLDRFKLINDTVGHLKGDKVLLQMAERLLMFIRPEDTLARLGGDEFAIVVEDVATLEDARALGARVAEATRAPFEIDGEEFICTTSVGVSVTPDAHHSAQGLLQEADLALYRAKDRGRDRTELFDEDLRDRAVRRLGTERMLRRAIHEDRLRVEYQPTVDLRTGATVAAEALVRVWDPEHQHLVPAESFIEVAEETGLLSPIDDWVFEEVMGQVAAWQRVSEGTSFGDVALNITARHLADAGFAQGVIDDLAARHLPATALQFEVTERVLMEASNSTMAGLHTLREAGIQVGLDDFGTGYSSLSYLRQFPLDFVKIDRSFVQLLASDGPELAIVASIIDLSHALGMAVVAEGVETRTQLDHLVALGCDRAQGFWFAPSGPPQAIEARLAPIGAHCDDHSDAHCDGRSAAHDGVPTATADEESPRDGRQSPWQASATPPEWVTPSRRSDDAT